MQPISQWSVTKIVTIITTAITGVIAFTTAAFSIHTMYEDEPLILSKANEVKEEVLAMSDRNTNQLLEYFMQQDIANYEDEIEELNSKDRDGHADRYELRKRDRYQNRIKQLERKIEQVR